MSPKPKADRVSAAGPVRWVSRAEGGTDAEDRLAALIRAAEPARELGTVGRARVWSRFRRAPRSRRPLASLRWGVTIGVLLTSGVVIGAMSARRWWPERSTGAPAPGPAKPHPAHAVRHRGERSGQAAALPDAIAAEGALPIADPAPEPSPVQDARAISDPVPPSSSPPRPATPSSRAHGSGTLRGARARDLALAAPREASASELAGETPLLSEALTRLRQKRDARGALATLDVYRTRYPDGTLRHEAETARVDALLLLGRDDEALAELRRLRLQAQGRDLELRLIRGELTAATDCARAVADFDRVLAERTPPAFAERALHGRAACRARLGDEAGAKSDLAEYLRRFPAGRFAPEARRRTTDRADDNL